MCGTYKESEGVFLSVLAVKPGNEQARRNLATDRRNLVMRARPALFNPHVTMIGYETYRFVLLQQLQKQQLSASLFTCYDLTDRALLWYFEAEGDINAKTWYASFQMYRPGSRTMAHDARTLTCRQDLC